MIGTLNVLLSVAFSIIILLKHIWSYDLGIVPILKIKLRRLTLRHNRGYNYLPK